MGRGGGGGVNQTTRLSWNDGSDDSCDEERWLKKYPFGGDGEVA